MLHFKKEGESGSTTRLRSTINIGGEYRLLENKLGIGLLSSTRLYSPKAYTELTLSVIPEDGYRLKSGSLQVYKTGDANTTVAYGIALNFSPSWINFFIGSDYMLTKVTPQCLPVSGNAMNLYMGVSVPLKSFAN